jgi:hypothetical protein
MELGVDLVSIVYAQFMQQQVQIISLGAHPARSSGGRGCIQSPRIHWLLYAAG